MKVTFKTGSEANYGSINGELFFASDTKQLLLNGVKYIPKKLSELTNDSGFLTSITKSMVENVLTGTISSHTHTFASLTSKPTTLSGYGITDAALASDLSKYLPLTGGTLTGSLTCNGSWIEKSGSSGGFVGYFNTPKRSDRAGSSHIFNSGWAYGTNAISLGASAYAGIRNTDSDSNDYPYLHWQWMDCLQVKEVTSAGDVNCYGAILNNSGGTKNTAKFTVCLDGVCKFYDENKGEDDPTNQFLKFTNTDASYGRVVVFIVDNDATYNKGLIFGGTTEHPRRICSLKIGNMILGSGSRIADVASTTINKKTVYRLAIYWWSGSLPASYDITKATTAMVCTKVNNSNYSGGFSVASGYSSVASGYSSVASGYYSVASGYSSVASGNSSVASGNYSVASGGFSVASGSSSVASGSSSVASGYSSVASGYSSVASGYSSVAKHEGSKVYALRGVSGRSYQTVLGRDNVETSTASVVVGWGSSDAARKNIFVLDTAGNATFGDGGMASVTAATFNGSLNGTATKATEAGMVENSLSITLGTSTTPTSYNGSAAISLSITPSAIGAAAASHTHSYIVTEGDNRSVATTPNDYSNKFTFKGLKYNSNIGSPTNDTYSYILGLRGWSDSSGGQSHELAFNNSGIYRRQGATTEWGSWYKILDSGNFNSYAATKDHTHLYAGSASAGGAATSAVKLNTSRKLWGQSFDGSADVYGNIYLYPSNMEVATTRGIREFSLSGFIGFVNPSVGDTDKFSGICLGWANNPTSADASLRINASTFAYKGNTVWHGGNLKLGYTSSGLLRAVQMDATQNLYVVAPSLFEQGISNNYPKNLRWITEDEGQLAYDTEETAGTTSTVQVGIPVAHETSKGFMKSISTVTDVTGYTPCPVKSGTPYYKLDAIGLDYTDLGIVSGSIESNVPINTTIQQDGSLGYLLNYTVDNIPRLLTIALGSYCKYFFWLQQTDDDTPIVAYYHCQFNDLWLVIDSPNTQVRISQGSF